MTCKCSHLYQHKKLLCLISTNGFRLGFGFQTLSLYCIMHNFFRWLRFGFRSLYRQFPRMVTVPILGMDLHPRNRSPSLFHTFQSGDQSLNLNHWEKSCIVQESQSQSESESVSGSGSKPLGVGGCIGTRSV